MKTPRDYGEETRGGWVIAISSTLGYCIVLLMTDMHSSDWREDTPDLLLAIALTCVFQFVLFRFLKWRDNRRVPK